MLISPENSNKEQQSYLYLHLLVLQKALQGMEDILAKRFMAQCFIKSDAGINKSKVV